MLVFVLWLLGVILRHCDSDSSVVDWAAYEALHSVDEDLAAIDVETLRTLVRALPLTAHWDMQKGAFKTSLLGELMAGQGDHLQTYLSNKTTRVMSNGTLVLTQVVAVDMTRVYMESLAVAQSLAETIVDTLRRGVALRDSLVRVSLSVRNNLVPGVASPTWASAACLASLADSLAPQVADVDARLASRSQSLSDKLAVLSNTTAAKRTALYQHSSALEKEDRLRSQRMHEIQLSRRSYRLSLLSEAELKDHDHGLRLLEAEHGMRLQTVNARSRARADAALFRVQEEGRQMREDEPHVQRLQQLEHSLRVDGIEAAVRAAAVEVRALVEDLLSDPRQVGIAAVVVVLVVCLLVLVGELGGVLRAYVVRQVLTPSYVVAASSAAESRRIDTTRFLSDHQLQAQLDRIRGIFLSIRQYPSELASVVLVEGQSGVGKTALLHHIGAVSGLTVSFINCKALQGSPSEFRRALQRAVTSRVVLVDDADEVLSSSASGGTHDMLYALLQATGLRGVVLVIATSLVSSSSAVDPALLDRVDEHVSLRPPSRSLREDFLKISAVKILSRLLPPEDAASSSDDGGPLGRLLPGLVAESEGWSFLEMEQFLLNVQSRVLGTESAVLTAEVWQAERTQRANNSISGAAGKVK